MKLTEADKIQMMKYLQFLDAFIAVDQDMQLVRLRTLIQIGLMPDCSVAMLGASANLPSSTNSRHIAYWTKRTNRPVQIKGEPWVEANEDHFDFRMKRVRLSNHGETELKKILMTIRS